ncbi:MAG: hypothetical protein RL199_863 [Pseudomonadota bacterium]|jgi:hypothetical protein
MRPRPVVRLAAVSLPLFGCAEVSAPTLSGIEQDIFVPRCNTAGCHDVTGRAGRLDLTPGTAYAQLVDVSAQNVGAVEDGLVRVVPGRSEASFLVQKLEDHLPVAYGVRMPVGAGPLTASEVSRVRAWVDAGARDD